MSIPLWLHSDPETAGRLRALKLRLSLLEAAGPGGADTVVDSVRAILAGVRARGDQAVLEYTGRFDRCVLTADRLRVGKDEIEDAYRRVPPELIEAIRGAASNIERYQRSMLVSPREPVRADGMTLRMAWRPVASAGVYVPGGSAPLCSSVLMSAVPARVAGVGRIAMATPPGPDGSVSPDRLVAAAEAGIEEIYRVGGAQAIGALAFGTESIRKVDFIVGPGNLYVTLAKREVFGWVGIDLLGGPSEVVIIADDSVAPDWLAADMISQAEHAPGSALLVTDSRSLAETVTARLEEQCKHVARGAMAARCLESSSAIVVCDDLDGCIRLANEFAPEHLEVMTRDADAVAARIENAGALFVGLFSPVAVGDYWAGPSHVLPTGGTARFSSGLSANTFLRSQSVISVDEAGLAAAAGGILRLTEAEGLDAHGWSVRRRLGQRPEGEVPP